MTDVIKTSVAVDQADVVGFLKEKYFAMKEAISDAEERHQKAVDSLNEPKAKTGIAKHEAALLKSRITKTKESIRVTKKALTDLKEDLGETKDEIQENKDWRVEFKEREENRVQLLEEMEEKCKDAKELLFENNRKFSEATRLLAMRQFDVEAVTARINKALEEIEEHKEMQKQSSMQMMHAEKRGGRNVERQLEQEQRIEATTNQIETIDDCTEDALRSINKLELKKEYVLDQINYWKEKTRKINEEIDIMNQDFCE